MGCPTSRITIACIVTSASSKHFGHHTVSQGPCHIGMALPASRHLVRDVLTWSLRPLGPLRPSFEAGGVASACVPLRSMMANWILLLSAMRLHSQGLNASLQNQGV